MSRSFLTPFLAGLVCGAALAGVASMLLQEPAAPLDAPQVAAQAEGVRRLSAQEVLAELAQAQAPAAEPTAPAPVDASTEQPDGVVEQEPEGPPTSMVITTALLMEAQQRAERVRDALENLPGGEDAPIAYQLEAYQKALTDNLGNLPLPDGADKKDLILEAFLWTDSVQKQFANMNPASRQNELNFVRRELGYTDAEVKELAQRDAAREARWQNGSAYTKERHRAAANLEGEALQKELVRLREKYFADEASTIAAEERDGFFRYESPRIYGRN